MLQHCEPGSRIRQRKTDLVSEMYRAMQTAGRFSDLALKAFEEEDLHCRTCRPCAERRVLA